MMEYYRPLIRRIGKRREKKDEEKEWYEDGDHEEVEGQKRSKQAEEGSSYFLSRTSLGPLACESACLWSSTSLDPHAPGSTCH